MLDNDICQVDSYSFKTRHYEDNGISFYIRQKVLRVEEIHVPKNIIKKPWFNDVLAVIRKHNPEYTEEELIGENKHGQYNKSVIEKIQPAHTKHITVYDGANMEL